MMIIITIILICAGSRAKQQRMGHGRLKNHHDDHLKYRGSPPGFWEIYHGDRLNGVMLQRLNNKLDDGYVIYKKYFRTIPYSYSENLNQLLMGCVKWPAIACQNILKGKSNNMFINSITSSAPIYRRPSNIQMLVYLLRLIINNIKK